MNTKEKIYQKKYQKQYRKKRQEWNAEDYFKKLNKLHEFGYNNINLKKYDKSITIF